MQTMSGNQKRPWHKWVGMGLAMLFVLLLPLGLHADKKKKADAADTDAKIKAIDYSNIVWPNPPAITRIRYVKWYSSDNAVRNTKGDVQKKSAWMDRLAGTQSSDEVFKRPFELVQPYGLAVDSQGSLYVADQKVGAIFIFTTGEEKKVELIKNGQHAHFVRIIGLAMDDDDRLFVSDPGLRHVLVFDKDHKAQDVLTEGMVEPGGLAIDTKNRFLYVADVELDQILVYDADTLKPLRKLGTAGKKHTLTTPGDFSKPAGVAVDPEGNLYVADTWNNRIEIFDADGQFVSAFGKAGDGPGYFSRPKGVAVDSDGHIWVADGMQDRVQVFDKTGQLLIAFGGHGLMPGQFQGLVGITIDKKDRVFTSEIYPGRAQEFQYVTDAQADQERQKKAAEREKTAAAKSGAVSSAPSPAPSAAAAPTKP
ncbi:MAG TPA: SMP-30/gluconolactonase/LRE family protein [Candidatus Sulfotelmatobacter sp.]|nr:SMP-30/gluconolactonase/LRE family protein [Candidatus Sulfotelmatobacter sp.]